MIEIKPTTRVHALWFVPIETSETDGDWLACVLKQEGEDWRAVYRFRWYRDGKAFDSDDVKSWFVVQTGETGDEPPESLVSGLASIASKICNGEPHKVRYLEVRGDGEKAVEMLRQADFAHIRVEPPLN